MGIPNEHEAEFALFPEVLQVLVTAELAAGNEVTEFGHGFPAAPCGAYIRLARPVTSHARKKTPVLDFYERNGSSHSGEFTDAQRHFFVLEPPHPDAGYYPDTNAIRAAIEAGQRAADAAIDRDQHPIQSEAPDPMRPLAAVAGTVMDRFRKSMISDFDSWHDGTGYDLSLFDLATPEELVELETMLISRNVNDWRDVEALAALNSPRARLALKEAMKLPDLRLRLAIVDLAPDLIPEAERVALLVEVLEGPDTDGGLTRALLQVESFHPPQVIDALFRGVLTKSEKAVHFAAMLMFLHGKAASSFDWDQRPFFLKFKTDCFEERPARFRELCEKVGVDAALYLNLPSP